MSDFRYLTFDCYGTLIDWRRGIEAALIQVMGPLPKRGMELASLYEEAELQEESSYKKYRVVLMDTALTLGRVLGKEISMEKAREFAASVPRWPPFPDTATSLRRLGEHGYKRYILSNVDNDLLEQTISQNGLEIDGFVTAEMARSYKPAHGHWEEFMAETGARTAQVLHVAQSIYHDIVPAQSMGISSAWVNRYGQPLPLKAQPDFVVDSLSSLVGILE